MSDELRPEYPFDYRLAKPNRFAAGLAKGGRLVVLDPEVESLPAAVADLVVRRRRASAMGSEPAASEDRRYAAMLLFQFRVITAGTSDRRRLCEKRLILLTAPDGRAALRAAKHRGRAAQYGYLNAAGGKVRFEFVGVLDLLHLGSECEPDEVWYQLCRLQEPMERRSRLLPPESRWQAIAEDQRHT